MIVCKGDAMLKGLAQKLWVLDPLDYLVVWKKLTTQPQCCQPQQFENNKREHKIFKIPLHLTKPLLLTYKALDMPNRKFQNEVVAQRNQRVSVSMTICIVQFVSWWVAPFWPKGITGNIFMHLVNGLNVLLFSKAHINSLD